MAGLIDSLKKQRFNEGDSMIASAAMHPADAAKRLKDWLENQINTGMGQPQLDESTGFYRDPTDEQQHEAAFNLAGLMETGSMPFAPKSAGGTLGTFIGPKAANWDAKAAADAAKMLDEGMSPTEVWRMKLMGRMPDKSMFSEIPDNEAVYRGLQGAKDAYAGDAYIHPELYQNYPTLENMTVKERPGGGGAYDRPSWSFTIGRDKTPDSTMAHEAQHAIQQREGWAMGGSPQGLADEREKAVQQIEILKNSTEFQHAMNRMNELIGNPEKYGKGLSQKELSLKAAEWFNNQPVVKRLNEIKLLPRDSNEAYMRLTGEAQARATQERLAMTMLQRRSNYPLEGGTLGGIPLDQLINRYGGEGPQQGGLLNLLKK